MKNLPRCSRLIFEAVPERYTRVCVLLLERMAYRYLLFIPTSKARVRHRFYLSHTLIIVLAQTAICIVAESRDAYLEKRSLEFRVLAMWQ